MLGGQEDTALLYSFLGPYIDSCGAWRPGGHGTAASTLGGTATHGHVSTSLCGRVVAVEQPRGLVGTARDDARERAIKTPRHRERGRQGAAGAGAGRVNERAMQGIGARGGMGGACMARLGRARGGRAGPEAWRPRRTMKRNAHEKQLKTSGTHQSRKPGGRPLGRPRAWGPPLLAAWTEAWRPPSRDKPHTRVSRIARPRHVGAAYARAEGKLGTP